MPQTKQNPQGRKPLPYDEQKIPVVSYHRRCDVDVIGITAARIASKKAVDSAIKGQTKNGKP